MACEIMMKLKGNIHWPILMTYLDFWGERSRSQQAVKLARFARHPYGYWVVKEHLVMMCFGIWFFVWWLCRSRCGSHTWSRKLKMATILVCQYR